MKNYIVHDAAGNILRTGVCQDHMLEQEAGEGETVIEGVANDLTDIIVKGKIQKKNVNTAERIAEVQEHIRIARNTKLLASDWTQLNDAQLSESDKQAWAIYRQELRDLPSVYSNVKSLTEIVWPTPPAS